MAQHFYVSDLSLCEGICLKQLQVVNVVTLHKAYDFMVWNNYCPVSILHVQSQVFEKLICERLLHFLNKFDISFRFSLI